MTERPGPRRAAPAGPDRRPALSVRGRGWPRWGRPTLRNTAAFAATGVALRFGKALLRQSDALWTTFVGDLRGVFFAGAGLTS